MNDAPMSVGPLKRRQARGMTVREIQGFLAEMYSVDVSPDLISSVTDAALSEVTAWQVWAHLRRGHSRPRR